MGFHIQLFLQYRLMIKNAIPKNYISHTALATRHVSPTVKHGNCLALQELNRRLTEKDHRIHWVLLLSVFNYTMQKIKSLMSRQVGYFSSYISLLLDFIDESGSL